MRIQNEEDVIESFPDFPLADICSLFMADKTDEVDNAVKNSNESSFQGMETERSWTETVPGKLLTIITALYLMF